MFDFGALAQTGEKVVEFIRNAEARLLAMETRLAELIAEVRAHREKVEPQVENLELAHKEIMGWIADIEGSEIVEAAAAIETAVAVTETNAAVAAAAAETAVAAAETVENPPEESPVPETPPPAETPPAETPPAAETPPVDSNQPLPETPIPPAEAPKERKRGFIKL